VYLSVGQHENERLRDGLQRFAATLRSLAPGSVPAWAFTDMADEDHSSTPQRSLYNALEKRFADYRFPFFEAISELEQAGGLQGLEAHYRRVTARWGYDAPPPESRLVAVGRLYLTAGRHDDVMRLAKTYARPYPVMAERLVNQVGYDLLKQGQVDQAVRTFRINADAFPGSPNTHDSLGDAYCRAGDEVAAKASFQQAARASQAMTPPNPRLATYQKKADAGCPPRSP
jgi:tetratricopeptide (TPR) repeat protein